VWLRELYQSMGTPTRGEDTQRAIDALTTIQANCDKLIGMNPEGVVEKALRVAIRVEEREYIDIYPHFRDQANAAQNPAAAAVYQKVIDSEHQHANWFRAALQEFFAVSPEPAMA
jgi:rubrerythrin